MSIRVLVVDDEPSAARGTRRLLERASCEVIVAMDTTAALEILGSSEIDVVVTDFDLAEPMTGGDLLGAVAARHPKVGRILLTGRASPPAVEADVVLQKPATMDELKRAILFAAFIVRVRLRGP